MIPGTNAALSVLLIDDDVELVRLLTQLFAREGIALRSATTGAAGLDWSESPAVARTARSDVAGHARQGSIPPPA